MLRTARVSHQTRPLGQLGTLLTQGPPGRGPEGHSTGAAFYVCRSRCAPKGYPFQESAGPS